MFGDVMKYCLLCLEPDTRPENQFEATGICQACLYHASCASIDWSARQHELLEISKWAIENASFNYDCIIPVSGGKDSMRQAFYARDELGLNPLLVTLSYPPEHQTERGARNMANLIKQEFNVITISTAPETWKKLARFSFFNFGNIHKPSETALYASVCRIAILYRIPLAIYGENPSLQFGGNYGSCDGNATRLKYQNTLSGGELSPYQNAGFSDRELFWFTFPSDADMARASLRFIFLGYYISDFNDWTNAKFALNLGLEPRHGIHAEHKAIGMITTYDALDDDFVIVNQMLKYFKFGFGKASEQASLMVRHGLMTRKEAIERVRDVDGQCADLYIHRICDYLGISETQFWKTANGFRNPKIWRQEKNQWKNMFELA